MKPKSPETRMKMSTAHEGKVFTRAHKDALSKAHTGLISPRRMADDETVMAIKQLAQEEQLTFRALAKRFEVSVSTVYGILSGRRYRNVANVT